MKLHRRHHPDNLDNLPLFASASEREARICRPVPLAARIVAIRHALPLRRAALVCELAGIRGAE